MCFAIQIEENISGEKYKISGEKPSVEAKFWTETRNGVTPAQGKFGGPDGAMIQQILPSLAYPAYDRYEKNPNVRSAEMFIRQGYSWIHNWIANSALRILTKNDKAKLVLSAVPSRIRYVEKDDFEHVLTSIYSYISIVIFVLPMYQFILRLQIEKQSGMKKHLQIIGLSQGAHLLALFVSYACQTTLISLAITVTMKVGGLFPKSFANSPLLLLSFIWLQGIANFGFIIMISAFLPHEMYPKMAAKWGTLIFFGSTFADFTIQKPGVSETIKVMMSFIFPNLATARASRNLCVFEYNPGGLGLSSHTLFEPYQHYRIITYYIVMVWALFAQLAAGILFEKW